MNAPGTQDRPEVPFRAGKLFSLLEEAGIDLLLASSPHNVRYLTGGYYYPLYVHNDYTARTRYLSFVGIPAGALADSFYVGRPGENEVLADEGVWVRQRFESGSLTSVAIAAAAAGVVKRLPTGDLRIGIEPAALPADAFRQLESGLPRARFVDAAAVLDALRAVKTPEEVARLREGTRRNREALEAVFRAGGAGLTTREIAGRVEREHGARQLHHLYALVCAGPGFFRAPSDRRRWQEDRLLHIDSGCLHQGYISELCRSGYLGRPSRLADGLLRGCADLEKAVLGQLRPGLPARELQAVAAEFLRGHPHGELGRFIAHGIGLVHHEDPVVSAASPAVLEAGMVLSLEMEFRHAEVGHVKLEDMVAIAPGGPEILCPEEHGWYLPD